MNRRQQLEHDCAFIALGLAVERQGDGFTIHELRERLVAAELATDGDARVRAGMAIHRVRREFGDDVVVRAKGAGREWIYRLSQDLDEAIRHVIRLMCSAQRRVDNILADVAAIRRKYLELVPEPEPDTAQALTDVEEALRRVQFDAVRAVRMLALSL